WSALCHASLTICRTNSTTGASAMIPSEPIPPSDQAITTTEPAANNKSAGHSRRVFLFKLSLLLNGAVGAVLAVPIVGYLLGDAGKKRAGDNSWISLGPLSDFPEGET